MAETIFDKIVSGEWSSFKVYEDDDYLAFLTPFGNVKGHTVLIPKSNPGSYIFEIDDSVYTDLMLRAKIVAGMLRHAFNVEKVGMVIDGGGVAHAHVQLIPMHGFHEGSTVPESARQFFEIYPGFVSSVDGPKMSDEQLEEIQKKIVEAS